MKQTAIFDTKQTKHNKTLKTEQNDKNRTNRQKLVTLPVMDRNEAEKKAQKHLYEKFGDCLMDIAKYCVTAILLSAIFTDLKERTPAMAYITSIAFSGIVFWIGAKIVYKQKRKGYENE